MSSETLQYASYLIRQWRDSAANQNVAGVYHAEVEHIQSGERYQFGNPHDLWQFLAGRVLLPLGASYQSPQQSADQHTADVPRE